MSMNITTLKADFNEVFDQDYVWVSLRRTIGFDAQQVQAGDWVELADEDGLSCWAVVTERTGPIVTCKIDPASWRSQVRVDLALAMNPFMATSRSAESLPTTAEFACAG